MERIWISLIITLLAAPAQAALEMHYIHSDHLGTPKVVTNQAQTVVWKGHLKPFGRAEIEIENITQHLRFPGQRFDIETSLHYNYFRDYDPRTGRYIQSDPIGILAGPNTYAYAMANPLTGFDPTGLDCVAIGESVSCSVPGTGGTMISFPRPGNWPDKIDATSPNYHQYDVPVPLDGVDPACVLRELAMNPTPGTGPGASQNGSLNNATPPLMQSGFDLLDQISSFGNDPGGYNNSPVDSYVVNDGTAIVNVTRPGHPLHPGYVFRSPTGPNVQNIGEGAGFLQGPFSPFAGPINNVWDGQTRALIEKCRCQ